MIPGMYNPHLRHPVAAIGLAVIIILVAYLPAAIHLDYVWDDWQLFIHRPDLRLPEYLLGAWFEPILPGTTYLRPLVLASFSFEFLTIGVDPRLSHGINLLLLGLNALLVGIVTSRSEQLMLETRTAWRPAVAALIYGLHPALIESTAWAAGRFDLMVTFFFLLALWCYLNLDGWRRTLWVGCAFAGAALSKEMAAVLPVVLVVLFRLRHLHLDSVSCVRRFLSDGEWRLHLILLAVGTGYLILRALAFGRVAHQDLDVVGVFADGASRAALVGQTLWFYLKLTFWPFANLGPQHPLDPSQVDRAWLIGGWLVVAAAIAFLCAMIRSRQIALWWFAVFMLTLLPVLNLVPVTIGGNIGHDRFLTLPLTLWAMGVVFLRVPHIRLSKAMQRTLPAMIAIMLATWTVVAIANVRMTVPLWATNFSLWSWAHAMHPEVPFVKMSFITAAASHRQFDAADAIVDRIEEGDSRLWGVAGGFLVRRGKFEEGVVALKRAEELLPRHHELVLAEGIDLDDAHLSGGEARLWLYQGIYTGFAEAYNSLRRHDQAYEAARIALFYTPRYPPAWLQKALALYGLDRWEEAEQAFAQALEFVVPAGREDVVDVRKRFLPQLCHDPDAAPSVCSYELGI